MSNFFNLDFNSLVKQEVETEVIDYEELRRKLEIDFTKEPVKPVPIISIEATKQDGSSFFTYACTQGEMSAIVAPSKSFKSMLSSAFVSAVVGGDGFNKRFQKIKSHNFNDFTIIHFDTEQGEYYAQKTFDRANKIIGYINSNYKCYPTRRLTALQRVEFMDYLIKNQSSIYNKPVKFVVIDGIADMVENTNDLLMSNEVATKLMQWTDIYGIHIMTVIHKNHGSDKPVGHLGSAVVKKAETIFLLERDEDMGNNVIKVNCSYSRGASFNPFYFTIDENAIPYEYGMNTPNNTDNFPEVKFQDVKSIFADDEEPPF